MQNHILKMPSADFGAFTIPILVTDDGGFRHRCNPVSVGIPFPKKAVFEPSELVLFGPDLVPRASQIQVLARWFDESIKWALVDFQAEVEPGQTAKYLLRRVDKPLVVAGPPDIAIIESADSIEVNTGRNVFVVDARTLMPFKRVFVDGIQVLEESRSGICLIDDAGQTYQPQIVRIFVETHGYLRSTLKVEGQLCSPTGTNIAEFISRLSFFAGSSVVKITFTLRNSRAASHPGGLWDLGDEGSIYFKALAIKVALNIPRKKSLVCVEHPSQPPIRNEGGRFEIYQDSSGGERWNSSNHVDRFGKVRTNFRGYRVDIDGVTVKEGLRASPTATIVGQDVQLAGAIKHFWQNFPKAIEVEDQEIRLGLFPHQSGALYELQAGEQKTHTVHLSFGDSAGVERMHQTLLVRSTPEWYAEAQAVPYLSPRDRSRKGADTLRLLETLVDAAVEGDNTFFDRRETIDEYGWRNFGDIYADHEAVGHRGDVPLVAHYNNQYDVIHGALVQYLRSADSRWFQLADDLAGHVVDIDIYHTSADRIIFNGGLFWHTDHYSDAATCTHRAYSKAGVTNQARDQFGGGPSSEHNYTTGLMEYYFLTGTPEAREAVLGLGDWVMNMDAHSGGLFGAIDRRPRGLCSMTVSWNYHGPGRGCGNSINALLDAYVISRNEKYWIKAEELIRRSIHPKENIESRNLADIEHRWSYTVFLQILAKYLDLKVARDEIDFMYAYARASLLHYARWMLMHEVPYRTVLDRVEIPTETWPAQDIRKANVFKFAAKYSDEAMRSDFLERSQFFFDRCIGDVLEFKTCILTRPLALLMTNGYVQSYFIDRGCDVAPAPIQNYDFGTPIRFKPQFYELYKARELMYRIKALLMGMAEQIRRRLVRKQEEVISERA